MRASRAGGRAEQGNTSTRPLGASAS